MIQFVHAVRGMALFYHINWAVPIVLVFLLYRSIAFCLWIGILSIFSSLLLLVPSDLADPLWPTDTTIAVAGAVRVVKASVPLIPDIGLWCMSNGHGNGDKYWLEYFAHSIPISTLPIQWWQIQSHPRPQEVAAVNQPETHLLEWHSFSAWDFKNTNWVQINHDINIITT